MKSADEIVRAARYRTGQSKFTYNSTTGDTSGGLATSIFLEALNDAQDHLQSRILDLWPSLFIAETEIPLVANTENYSVGSRLSFGSKLISVQFSQTGQLIDYVPLRQLSIQDRQGWTGIPFGYYRQGQEVYLIPIPSDSNGKLRVHHYRRLDDLDISRGAVNGTPISQSIVVTSGDTYELSNATYICISDKFGNVLLRNGEVSSYNSGTNTLTLAANVSTYLEGDYTLSNLASKYITVGENTTRFSTLPDECERYLRVYVQKRIMTISENSTSIEEDQELINIRDDILNAFGDESRDVTAWVITDKDSYY